MANPLDGKTILIMATDGFEQSELETPRDTLREVGATVVIASQETGEITGWDKDDWGSPVTVDAKISDVKADDYDALVLPGGQINPDLLRVDSDALNVIKAFDAASKTIAAICHAPWLLIEAGLAKGRRMTSYQSIRTDLANAGAEVVNDAEVVTDGHFITSRNPGDLEAFCQCIIESVSAKQMAPAE